ncbi:MAG TPA: penicillin-binding transpeptidase domain-containing protein [Micromonosporaceae bacterium]|nr:penicillin-binding transpeptidase domain-containing protein [Micromonosporaceae bacterium]
MNAPLRKAGVVMMILFGLLFAQLNWIQVYKADEYRTDDEHNRVRVQQYEYERERGRIIVDGEAVAVSEATKNTLRYLRTYPSEDLYAHVVGYRPVNLAATGIERLENEFLNGTADAFAADRILEMFTGKQSTGGNVVLSIKKRVQEAAYRGLVNNDTAAKAGAVVAIDPETGAILAMVSTPSFDPNPLVSHNFDEALEAYRKLEQDPAKPLLNRAIAETFPPGSTFKVIVATAALRNGLSPTTEITGGETYTAPTAGQPIRNAPGVSCPDTITLQNALRVSCNTAFARLGVEQLGADAVKRAAQDFGFETVPSIERDERNVIGVTSSRTGPIQNPDGTEDPAVLAQSCIGQNEVRMTPLQGALIAAAIANNGVQMRPYLIDTLQGPDLNRIGGADPEVLRRPVTPEIAAQLREMMNSVVSSGTGTNARIEGFEVGGKTGTAETGDDPDHGWFIGYARKDGRPVVAVAVLLQNAGPGGSAEAAQIAGEVMRAGIAAKGLN